MSNQHFELMNYVTKAFVNHESRKPAVDSIDLTLDGGTTRFAHVEKANEGLTDEENALVFVFDYTDAQAKLAQAQSTFRIGFFQNGTELTNRPACHSSGGDQYDLVGAYFNEAMKGVP